MKWLLVAAGLSLSGAAMAQERTFGELECTVDCSGHKAGYEWAELNGIDDISECIGNSRSFEEGCEVYVDDPLRGAWEDDDGNVIE